MNAFNPNFQRPSGETIDMERENGMVIQKIRIMIATDLLYHHTEFGVAGISRAVGGGRK